jgi:hypothetical protein
MGADAPAALRAGVCAAAVPSTAAAAQIGADAPEAGLTEIAAFIGVPALPPQTGTMGPGGGWPTLTKTNYVEWPAVMRIRL